MLYQLSILHAERVKGEDLVEFPRFGCVILTVRLMDNRHSVAFRRDDLECASRRGGVGPAAGTTRARGSPASGLSEECALEPS
jgi:hypothetical protein